MIFHNFPRKKSWVNNNPQTMIFPSTKVLWPPEPGSPQVMTEPSARRAAKEPRAPWREAWMAVLGVSIAPGGSTWCFNDL